MAAPLLQGQYVPCVQPERMAGNRSGFRNNNLTIVSCLHHREKRLAVQGRVVKVDGKRDLGGLQDARRKNKRNKRQNPFHARERLRRMVNPNKNAAPSNNDVPGSGIIWILSTKTRLLLFPESAIENWK